MSLKDYLKPPELIENQKEHEKPDIHSMYEFMRQTNLSAKMEMAKELCGIGLSQKAIGNILHLSEEVMAHHKDTPEVIGKKAGRGKLCLNLTK